MQEWQQLELLPVHQEELAYSGIKMTLYMISSAITFNFLIEQIISIDVLWQTSVITLFSIYLILTHKQNPKEIFLLYLSLIASLFCIPFSIVAVTPILVSRLLVKYNESQQKDLVLLQSLLIGSFMVYCSSAQNIMSIDPTYIYKILLLLASIFFMVFLTGLYLQYQKYKSKSDRVYNVADGRRIIQDGLFLLSVCGTVLTLLLRIHCHSKLIYKCVLGFLFLINAIFSLGYLYFKEQIIFWVYLSNYKKEETVFRVHQRQYSFQFQQNACQKKMVQKLQDQQCLMCSKKAVMIGNPCGHLTLCHECAYKNMSDRLRMCVMCHRTLNNYKRLIGTANRCGYRRKVTIQKKLMLNQHLVQP